MQRRDLDLSNDDSIIEQPLPKSAQQVIAQNDNHLQINNSNFQSEYNAKYNPYLSVSVNGPKWSKEGGVGSFRLYKIETRIQNEENKAVYRRYSDFEWLFQMLKIKFPSCIIPPIPSKSALQNWYNDESESVQRRKQGLERFLQKVMYHRLMCDSDDLKSFVSEPDHVFEEKKRVTKALIEEQNDQQQSYSAMAYSTITNAFSKASEKIGGLVWNSNNQPSTHQPAIRKYSFGEKNPAAQEELDRFQKHEDYLETLKGSFHQLAAEILVLIECTEESSKNYSNLSENFSSFTNMKGANIEQLQSLSKEISQTFQGASVSKKEELEDQIKKLKEPIDDYKLMIDAAIDACLRRRKLVFKFYELKEKQTFAQQQLSGQDLGDSGQMRQQYLQLTKKVEEMQDKVSESTKILSEELKQFKAQKEDELKKLISEFVRIEKRANDKMKMQWSNFLSKADVNKEAQNLDSSQMFQSR